MMRSAAAPLLAAVAALFVLSDLTARWTRRPPEPSVLAEPSRPEHFECSDATMPALSGRDVVAYYSLGAGESSVRGSPEFAVAHEGLTYRFASQAHLRLFEASPERYLPEYGAFCSWGMSTEFAPDWRWARDNLGPPVDPDVFVVLGGEGDAAPGRLFLFLKADVRDQFLQSPAEYVASGDARWREFFPNGTAPLRNTMCFRCGDAGLARACA